MYYKLYNINIKPWVQNIINLLECLKPEWTSFSLPCTHSVFRLVSTDLKMIIWKTEYLSSHSHINNDIWIIFISKIYFRSVTITPTNRTRSRFLLACLRILYSQVSSVSRPAMRQEMCSSCFACCFLTGEKYRYCVNLYAD